MMRQETVIKLWVLLLFIVVYLTFFFNKDSEQLGFDTPAEYEQTSKSIFKPELTPVTANVTAGGAVGQKLKDFSFTDKKGYRHSLFDFVYGRKTLIYVYSPGCGHCQGELSKFSEYIKKLSGDVQVLGISFYGGPEFDVQHSNRYGIPGPTVIDKGGKICGQFGIGDFTVMTTDINGIIKYRGGIDDFEKIVKSLR